MYRYNESTDFVVHIANVNLIIPTSKTLTKEQQNDENLIKAHNDYLTFIDAGGIVLEQQGK